MLILGESATSAAQLAVAGAVVVFGVSTTAMLHMITSPYVLYLRKVADGSYEVSSIEHAYAHLHVCMNNITMYAEHQSEACSMLSWLTFACVIACSIPIWILIRHAKRSILYFC